LRFIKKASIDNISELADIHKEFELYTDREDFTEENLNKIKKVYDENGAIITAIHCPVSKYKTKLDDEKVLSTNYMSWCEILGDKNEEEFFLSICKFADNIANIYNVQNNYNLSEKDNENDSKYVSKDKNKEKIAKVIIILHTGCIIGCCENTEFKCPYATTNVKDIFETVSFSLDNFLCSELQKFNNIEIVFENITPFYDGKEIGKNSGYGYENLILAEKLNKVLEILNSQQKKLINKDSNKMFGAVIDFCHIFATHKLLEAKNDKLDYFKNYINGISEEKRKLIRLCHLSKYDITDNLHGSIFTDTVEDQNIINEIRDWSIRYLMNIPITLEVADSDDAKRGNENFFKLMLNWSKLHIMLKYNIDSELYKFFENLYEFYSLQINMKNKDNAIKIACDIRDFILEESILENKLFNFNCEKQDLDVYLLQVQSYIYYMRYCNLALDLKKIYKGQEEVNISTVLKHYMFSDELDEIRFDGLGSYYKIYWIKSNENLYRCYDGCTGGRTTETDFKEVIKNCFSHIAGGFNTTQFLSFGKTFGRTMIKYFDPTEYGKIDDIAYNIMIIKKAPINCFFVNDTDNVKEITLQEYQKSKKGYTNFSIDFSDFYNDRGDSNKEASLKELYEKVYGNGTKWHDSSIGSIYDKEVILCNANNTTIIRYYLNALEFIIMMVSFSIVLNWDNKENQMLISSVVDKTFDSKGLLNDDFVKPYKNNIVITKNIKEILNIVDFEYERNNRIKANNEGFTDFAKAFNNFYKGIVQNDFYKHIVSEIKKGGENDVAR